MKNFSILTGLLLAIFGFSACNDFMGGSDSKNVELKTSLDSLSYSIGVSIGSNMNKQGLDSLNVDMITAALRAAIKGDSTKIALEEAGMYIQQQMTAEMNRQKEADKKKGNDFLEENKAKEGVQITASGLQYQVIQKGKGVQPGENDTVLVQYEGRLIDGTIFDSSIERGEPAEFSVNGVIPGWSEALKMMKEGGKWKLYVPSGLAYGERGAGPNIPPNSVLIFDVELLKVIPGNNP